MLLRYVKASAVYESFLTNVTAHDITAEGLSTLITNTLSQHNLPLSLCLPILRRSFCDEWSIVRGSSTDSEVMSSSHFMHCFAHRLNLVLVDCSKNVEFVSEFFSVYHMLYLFCHLLLVCLCLRKSRGWQV